MITAGRIKHITGKGLAQRLKQYGKRCHQSINSAEGATTETFSQEALMDRDHSSHSEAKAYTKQINQPHLPGIEQDDETNKLKCIGQDGNESFFNNIGKRPKYNLPDNAEGGGETQTGSSGGRGDSQIGQMRNQMDEHRSQRHKSEGKSKGYLPEI